MFLPTGKDVQVVRYRLSERQEQFTREEIQGAQVVGLLLLWHVVRPSVAAATMAGPFCFSFELRRSRSDPVRIMSAVPYICRGNFPIQARVAMCAVPDCLSTHCGKY